MKRRVLVVEDDASLARPLCDNLVYEGFDVSLVADGTSALKEARALQPDLVLLDVMLPGLNGLEVCRRLALSSTDTAVIILTARNQNEDKLRGFQVGADDYVTKPFTLDELLARVHAVLRRTRPTDDSLVLGSLKFDFKRYSATRGGRAVAFTQRELEVLHYMKERAGKVVTRDELLHRVWGYQNVPVTRCVDNLIARLRMRIEEDSHQPKYIQTVHGDGYRLTPDK
jgi:DNA-binding response OmpR family regulator